MPNHLEYVVRPSQTKGIRPGTRTQLFEPPKVPDNDPITWGSGGDSVFDLQAHAQWEAPEPKFEAQRTYDVVRVFNPDDRDQFVDTEQMTEYQARQKIDKSRFTLRFQGNQDTTNTKVISKNNIRRQPDADA